jgi:hypothetical protein
VKVAHRCGIVTSSLVTLDKREQKCCEVMSSPGRTPSSSSGVSRGKDPWELDVQEHERFPGAYGPATCSPRPLCLDVLFHLGDLHSDARSRWQHLCWEMWMDKEQAMPGGRCLITWGPQEAISCVWRNCFLCLQPQAQSRRYVG